MLLEHNFLKFRTFCSTLVRQSAVQDPLSIEFVFCRLSKVPTLTRNALSPATCRSVVASSLVSCRKWRCSGLLSSEGIIFITSGNITDLRNGTETCLFIFRRALGKSNPLKLCFISPQGIVRFWCSWKAPPYGEIRSPPPCTTRTE